MRRSFLRHSALAGMAVVGQGVAGGAGGGSGPSSSRSGWNRALELDSSRSVIGGSPTALRDAIRRWLAVDPAAADAWMRSGDHTDALAPTIEPFAIWLSQKDPAEAIRWAERIPDEAQRARMLWAIGRRWRVRDAEGFGAWLAEAELAESTRDALQRAPRADASGAVKPVEAQESEE